MIDAEFKKNSIEISANKCSIVFIGVYLFVF